ncbi:MAG: DUF4434 domain-containing protein [Bacteroidales bacterium]|jgi:hypothetical protein|nr:DUF4434 domain-containing protein [Bacteroidales bacterium]
MNRRTFIHCGGLAAVPAAKLPFSGLQDCRPPFVKPITGSWFEFEHHNRAEGKYWNREMAAFTAGQWKAKVKEMHDAGLEYLVLLAVACDGKTYYPSDLQPRHDYACDDPLEAVLAAADECGVKFFISNDYWSDWQQAEKAMSSEDIQQLREKGMEEVAEKYAHHKSFYGWYYPNESELRLTFDEIAIRYVNRCSKKARALTPKAVTLMAPYGTRSVRPNDNYIRQLEQLDVDIIAYQDEVGVRKTQAGSAGQYFEYLYGMHVKAGRARLWADMEIFDFEGEVYKSALMPAPFERVLTQLKDVSPFVENVLAYQYLGMMNSPGTAAFAGHADSEKLYTDYMNWLKTMNPTW